MNRRSRWTEEERRILRAADRAAMLGGLLGGRAVAIVATFVRWLIGGAA